MRVCFISRRFFPTISGMSVYALNLLRELVRNKVDATMIAQFRGDELGRRVYGGGEPLEVPGVKVIGLESIGEQQGGDFELDIERIVDAVTAEHKREPFDLVHAQYGYPPGLSALEVSKRLNIPNVVSIQGGDGHWVGSCCRTHRSAMQTVLNYAGAVLIGSRSFAEEVIHNNGTAWERFTFVPGAVNTARFHPRASRQAGEFIEKDNPKFFYHGRVDARKGALDLVEAFDRLLKDKHLGCQPELIVSGIGPDSERVREKVFALNLENSVQMLGYAEYGSVPDIYRRADIFVSPTYAEGFSNTILEAMASGLPIVSTRAVGVVDCLRDNENALLVEPQDIAGLTAAMREILVNNNLRKRLAVNALAEARELYSWEKVGGMIIGVYQNLLGTTPDNNWSLSDKIEPCRYRETPHLL